MPVYTSGKGYNGVTGAVATYNAGEGMWIDTAGARIRTDAIVPGDPPAKKKAEEPTTGGSSPAAPTSPAAVEPGSTGVPQFGAPDVAVSSGQGGGAGYQELSSPSALNPSLGQRIYPGALRALAQMAGRNY